MNFKSTYDETDRTGLQKIIEEWKGKPLRELLIELYIDKDMSLRDMEKVIYVSRETINRWLKEFGISKNRGMFKERKKQ